MNKLYNPIAIYNFNNKKYFVALDENKIVYFKYENNQISDDYSREELEVFLKVYDSIKIDKNSSINLGVKDINGKKYETFYDLKKQLYFWYEVIDGKRHMVSKSDLETLNYKYNNFRLSYFDDETDGENSIYDWKNDEEFLSEHSADMEFYDDPESMYDWERDFEFNKSEKREKAKTIKRAIFHGGKVIAIILVSGVSLVTLSDKVLHTNIAERIRSAFGVTSVSDEMLYEDIENEPYSFDIIENAISINQNISEEEKAFMLKFKPYFDQNHNYMDMKTMFERISTLKIEYTTEECKSPQVAGEYNTTKNVITIYKTDSFENCDKSTFAHEFFHVTQKGFSKRLTMELSNELTTREYLRTLVEQGILSEDDFINEYDVPVYGDGYDQCMKVYYLMANLFDMETIKKYQCIPADSILVSALVEIDEQRPDTYAGAFDRVNREKRAIELLDAIDELRSEADIYGYRTIMFSREKYNHICELLDHYYEIKFDKTIDECFVEDIMRFDNTYGTINTTTAKGQAIWNVMLEQLEKRVENLDEKYKIPMGEYRYVLPKTYFTNRHQNPIVYFNTYEKISEFGANGFFVDIEITPEVSEAYAKEYKRIESEMTEKLAEETKSGDEVSGMGNVDSGRELE